MPMTPKGSRVVARGAAQRNPWMRVANLDPPRMGRRRVAERDESPRKSSGLSAWSANLRN